MFCVGIEWMCELGSCDLGCCVFGSVDGCMYVKEMVVVVGEVR